MIRRRLWTTADLEQAMVMVGDGASLRAASSTYKVPVETLRRRIAKDELYHSHKLINNLLSHIVKHIGF